MAMKMVTARIQTHRLDPVYAALLEVGVSSVTAIEAKGYGEMFGHTEVYRGAEYQVAFMQLVKIEAIVEDSLVDKTVAALRKASSTDPDRSSRVWVYDMELAVPEEGEDSQ
jgi:nitrogen regulatory protein PII